MEELQTPSSSIVEVPQESKFDLEKDFKEKLKLFLFLAKNDPQPPPREYKIVGILDYRSQDALPKAAQQSKNGFVYYGGDYISIDHLLSKIASSDFSDILKIEKDISITGGVEETPSEKLFSAETLLGIDQFKHSLELVLDAYIKDEKDREELRKIIAKIKDGN